MELPDGQKSFKIGLAILIQYLRVTSSHAASRKLQIFPTPVYFTPPLMGSP